MYHYIIEIQLFGGLKFLRKGVYQNMISLYIYISNKCKKKYQNFIFIVNPPKKNIIIRDKGNHGHL